MIYDSLIKSFDVIVWVKYDVYEENYLKLNIIAFIKLSFIYPA